jgi:hypothetical protein
VVNDRGELLAFQITVSFRQACLTTKKFMLNRIP